MLVETVAHGIAGIQVLDTILAFYAALVARDSTVLADLVSKSDFINTLHHMLAALDHANDPLWLISTNAGLGELKAAGISKAENTLVSVDFGSYSGLGTYMRS